MTYPQYYAPNNYYQQSPFVNALQQTYQPQQQAQQTGIKIIPVSNKDEANATPVDLISGIPTFFYNKGTKEVAELAEKYITDNKERKIGFKWDYQTVLNQVEGFINLNETEFYPADIWVWANVKYGDMQHITTDSALIIKYAISELTDPDYPFYDASQRAYCWLKKHIENEN